MLESEDLSIPNNSIEILNYINCPQAYYHIMQRKKIAIVGSGCSGIAALWALKKTLHEVHLYESMDRLGGHTNTVTFHHDEKTTNVDTGFIVMNSATYRSLKFSAIDVT